MSSPQAPPAQTKARVTLLVLVAVFGLPLALAWVLAIGFDWRPENTVNHGVLLEPALRLKSFGVMDRAGAAPTGDAIAGDWFVVVLRNAACTETCQRLLQIAEQVGNAVGRDIPRVRLALLGPDDETPDAPARRWQTWLLPADGRLVEALAVMGEPRYDHMVLIVDHLGRVALMYPPGEDGHGVLADLKRLLRASAPP
ncbi:MAG: hypothetical protein O7B25_00105 [Gammaproteobacteria bacterium]|nr:hypothetical protein [Gammaproteobacteria bacterium]